MNVKRECNTCEFNFDGICAGHGDVSLLFGIYFIDHDIIDTINISIKKRNSAFMQAQVIL